MPYEISIEELKKLIGDITLENFALKRDNIKLAEQLQTLQTRNVTQMPEPRQELRLERELDG